MLRLLEKSWVALSLASVAGLVLPGLAPALEPYLTYILMLLMIFSVKNIDIRKLFNKNSVKKGMILFLMNYALSSGIILLLSFTLPQIYKPGFIVMAAVPCAIAVMPFSKLLKADSQNSMAGLLVTYLFSLVITPGLIFLYFRESVDLYELFKTILLLVLLPLIISRFLKRFNSKLEKYDTVIINMIFFVGIYGFVGLNQSTIVNEFLSLKTVLLALFLRTLVLTLIVYFLTKKQGRFGISMTIFSGFKNLGYAAIIGLALFGREASLPATLGIMFETFTFIVLERIIKD